jgi:VCBS repeat protein/List-Bact-rpt repeat protein/FG-GAP repeat protein
MKSKNRIPRIGIHWFLAAALLLSVAAPAATTQVQFSGPTNYPVGTSPVAVAVGDFNGDGKLDLAVANSGSGDVSILLGNGDGTFEAAVNYSVGGTASSPLSPTFVAAGDFNGDGKLDLAVANGSANTVSILLGNGNGTFQPPVEYGAGIPAAYVAVADFNGDGKADLLASSGGAVSILLGNGDATFRPPLITSASSGVQRVSPYVAVGDFNGDSHLDVAVEEASGSVEHIGGSLIILLGRGDGTFSAPATYPIADLLGASGVAAGDFNSDGKIDLAVAASTGIFIMLGNGDGTFSLSPNPQNQVHGGYGFGDLSLALADLNRQGNLDLVALNIDYAYTNELWTIEWGLGNGDGTFQGPIGNVNPCAQSSGCIALSYIPNSLAVGDFNGDNLPDLVVANQNIPYTSTLADNVSVFLNANTTFTLSLTLAGSGRGSITSSPAGINCPGSCASSFDSGTAVTLTAAPSSGSVFAGWSGDCTGTGACSLSMSADESATATFNLIDFSLGAASAKLTVQPGAQGTDVITVTPQGSLTSPVLLTCAVTGPSPAPTCALSPASVTPGANPATSTLTISVPSSAMVAPVLRRQFPTAPFAAWPLFALLGFTLIYASKKQEGRRWVACSLLLLLFVFHAACGGNTLAANKAPVSYAVSITGTSGALVHTTQITVTVP